MEMLEWLALSNFEQSTKILRSHLAEIEDASHASLAHRSQIGSAMNTAKMSMLQSQRTVVIAIRFATVYSWSHATPLALIE